MTTRGYDLLLVVHRWVALVASVLILVVALTGSALVFEGAMDRALHPELWRVSPGERWLPLDSLIAAARATAPGSAVASINLPLTADRSVTVQVGPNQVFVDPYTAKVRGRRTPAEVQATLPRRIHLLHVRLMSGNTGGEIVGVITGLALFLVVTGVILWWRDKLWRVRWSASWKRVVFDLHHSLGVFAAIVITVIASSGLFIHYDALSNALPRLDRSPPPKIPAQPTAPAGTPTVSADSVYHVATRALPGARVMFLSMPAKMDQPFLAALRFPEDRTPGGRSRVLVDRFSGNVLLALSTRDAQLGTRLGNTIRSIHTGDLFGKPTEAIWLAAAIVLATQALSGVTMWWNGRAARAALARAERTT